jgi:hypothetical protein
LALDESLAYIFDRQLRLYHHLAQSLLLSLLIVDQELLEALWDLAGGSLRLDHDDVAFELTNAFLCSH